jgi:Transglutaminase-like superfamily
VQTSIPIKQISSASVATERPVPLSACFLSAHAYACEFEDGAIILDLCSDTYVGIHAQYLPGIRACVENWPESECANREGGGGGTAASGALIDDLRKRRILTNLPTSRQLSPGACPTMALTVMNPAETRPPIPIRHVVQFAIAFLAVLLCLRRKKLPVLVDWIRGRQFSIHREHSGAREDLLARLRSFLWLRTWCYTAQRRCLFDSLVLSVYLTRGMTPCTFVIAVATKPFLAHAWVQIGELVLNDTAERVQDFTPMLSAGGK